MEASYKIYPKNDLKSHIKVPFILSISPCNNSIDWCINDSNENLSRCRVCHAYLSPFSHINSPNNNLPNDAISCVNSNWECQICGNKNPFGPNINLNQIQMKYANYEFILNTVDHDPLAYCIFLSTNFADLHDFYAAKIFCCSILRKIGNNSDCIIFIGNNSADFSILVPPVTQFENEKVLSSQKSASLARFSSINSLIGLDLGNFFFNSKSAIYAERAIEKLPFSEDASGSLKACEIAVTLSQVLEGRPLRVFGLFPNLSDMPATIPVFNEIRSSLIRMDFIVSFDEYSKQALLFSEEMQGVIHPLSTQNPALQALYLVRQDTNFQLFLGSQSKMCSNEWKKTHHPFSQLEKSKLFAPVVINQDQSFALELSPIPNQSKICVQVTAKFYRKKYDSNKTYYVCRIYNKIIETSEDFDLVVSNINWNVVFWYWSRLLIDKPHRECITMIFRTSATIISEFMKIKRQLNNDLSSSNEQNTLLADKENDVIPNYSDFLKAVCAFPDFYFVSGDLGYKFIGSELIAQLASSHLHFIPIKESIDGHEVIQSPNGIHFLKPCICDERKTLLKAQEKYPFFLPLNSSDKPFSSFTEIEKTRLTQLQNIVQQYLQ